MASSKKLSYKGTLRQVFIYLSPPPSYILYACILYTFSDREGGGEMNQREG
jgi:hypothetical protein